MDFKVATNPPGSRSKYQRVIDTCRANPNTWYEAEFDRNDYQGLRIKGLNVVKRGNVMYFKWAFDEEG